MKLTNRLLTLGFIGLLIFSTAGCSRDKGKVQTQDAGGKTAAYWVDAMNPSHRYDKPGKAPDGMDLVPVYAGEAGAKGIRIDPAVVQNIGVTTEAVRERALQREIRTNGTLAPNEQKVYDVNSKIMGWAEKLYVNYTGERVTRGQPLLDLYSPELVSTQEEYLQALRYAKSLPADASEDARRGAQEMADSSRRRLLNWDIPDSEIQSLTARGTATKTMTLRSPDNGVVLEKMVEQGKRVEPGMSLYRIADLSTVWIMADIYQQDLPFVQIGQNVEIQISSWAGKTFKGRVAYLSPVVNPDSKTAQARIEVRNTPDLQLKPGMFATVRIASPVAVKAVAIPEQAVIHSGERHIAVLDLGNGYFDPREVHLGITAGGYVQVLHGIQAGEKVVTSAQFLIDSESNLKSAVQSLSAGHQDSGALPNLPGMENKPAGKTPEPGGHEGMNMPVGPEPKEYQGHEGMNMPGMDKSVQDKK